MLTPFLSVVIVSDLQRISHQFRQGFDGLPFVFRKIGKPVPPVAVFISFRVSSATSGRIGILRVFFVFVAYTRHIIPRSVSWASSAFRCAISLNGRKPVGIAAKSNSRKHDSVAPKVNFSLSGEIEASRGLAFASLFSLPRTSCPFSSTRETRFWVPETV